jgi:hypothetical protein
MTEQGQGHGRTLVGLSDSFRDKRNAALRAMIARLSAARPAGSGPFRIVDLGGSFAYWERVGIAFLDTHDVTVTCINMTEGELKVAPAISPRLIAEIGNACNLSQYADMSFDMVHSNSVIEHVGRFPDMRDFAREVQRLAPAYYVQTPYFWFPIDPHSPRLPFYHWLPISLQLKLQRTIKLGWSKPVRDVAHAMSHIDSTVLLDRTRFHCLFPGARTRFERVMLLPKSMIVERG